MGWLKFWIVVVVENGASIPEGGVLAGGGGAALASDNTTNVLPRLSSTRIWRHLGWHVVRTQIGWQDHLVY
jgi:hypothetical protein